MSFSTEVSDINANVFVTVEIDKLSSIKFVIRDRGSTPPSSPADTDLAAGHAYQVVPTGTGAWSGQDNDIAVVKVKSPTSWIFHSATIGDVIFNRADEKFYRRTAGAWTEGLEKFYFGTRHFPGSSQQYDARIVSISNVSKNISDHERQMSRPSVSVDLADVSRELIQNAHTYNLINRCLEIKVHTIDSSGSIDTKTIFTGQITAFKIENRKITITSSDNSAAFYSEKFGTSDDKKMDEEIFDEIPDASKGDVANTTWPIVMGNFQGTAGAGQTFKMKYFDTDVYSDTGGSASDMVNGYLVSANDSDATDFTGNVYVEKEDATFESLTRGTGTKEFQDHVNFDYPSSTADPRKTINIVRINLTDFPASTASTGYTQPVSLYINPNGDLLSSSGTKSYPGDVLQEILKTHMNLKDDFIDTTSFSDFDTNINGFSTLESNTIFVIGQGLDNREILRKFSETYYAMFFFGNDGKFNIKEREMPFKKTSVNTTYTTLVSDSYIEADPSGGAFTITLERDAALDKRIQIVKNIDSTNNVTVKPEGSTSGTPLTIDDADDLAEDVDILPGETYVFYPNGLLWVAGKLTQDAGVRVSQASPDHTLDKSQMMSFKYIPSQNRPIRHMELHHQLSTGTDFYNMVPSKKQGLVFAGGFGLAPTKQNIFDPANRSIEHRSWYDENKLTSGVGVVHFLALFRYIREKFGADNIEVVVGARGFDYDLGDVIAVTTLDGEGSDGFDDEWMQVVGLSYNLNNMTVTVKLERPR